MIYFTTHIIVSLNSVQYTKLVSNLNKCKSNVKVQVQAQVQVEILTLSSPLPRPNTKLPSSQEGWYEFKAGGFAWHAVGLRLRVFLAVVHFGQELREHRSVVRAVYIVEGLVAHLF